MKKHLVVLTLILVGVGFCWGVLPVRSAGAAPETKEVVLTAPDPIAIAVNEFLATLPSDFLAIKQVDALKDMMETEEVFLLDVREPSEYLSGHIKGATNIPLRLLGRNRDRIPKDRLVIVYCASGYRTAMGVMALQMLGYENVRGFPPSMRGWQAAGEPVES